MDPSRFSLAVRHANGDYSRFGPDEPDARNVLQSGSFTTVAPGGFGTLSATLERDVSIGHFSDLERFDTMTLYGAGGRVAWEGYDLSIPASKGDGANVSIVGTGWSNALADDEALVVLFVTRDIGSVVGEAPLLVLAGRVSAGTQTGEDVDTNVQAHGLKFSCVSNKTVPQSSLGELWATAPGGTKFASFACQLDYKAANASSWFYGVYPQAAEDGSSAGTVTGSSGANSGTVVTYTLSAVSKWIQFITYWNALAGTPANPFIILVSKLAFYGNHGLTTYGISGEAPGVLASDAISWAITNGALTSGWAKNITPSSFVIGELGFPNGASVQEIIETANAFEQFDYFVWEGPTFNYAPVGSGATTWHVRTSDGAKLSDQGEQSEDTWTDVLVFYNEPTGEAKVIGPPGYAARCDYTDSSLTISDANNVALRHGHPRIKNLSLPFPTTKLGAIQIGAKWLADYQNIAVQGSVVCPAFVFDPNGVASPSYMMRAGDYVVIDDVSSTARYIVGTSYDIEARTLSADLDSPAHRIDAWLARFAEATRS